MKRIALFVLGVVAISSSPSAQAPADAIATALLGLPANVREGATVIKWKPDQTYDTLQKGTNGLVCYDRSGFPLQQPFSVECTSMGNLPRVAQNMKAEATRRQGEVGGDAQGRGRRRNPCEARVRLGVVPHGGA